LPITGDDYDVCDARPMDNVPDKHVYCGPLALENNLRSIHHPRDLPSSLCCMLERSSVPQVFIV
jgi:hypothetical protein